MQRSQFQRQEPPMGLSEENWAHYANTFGPAVEYFALSDQQGSGWQASSNVRAYDANNTRLSYLMGDPGASASFRLNMEDLMERQDQAVKHNGIGGLGADPWGMTLPRGMAQTVEKTGESETTPGALPSPYLSQTPETVVPATPLDTKRSPGHTEFSFAPNPYQSGGGLSTGGPVDPEVWETAMAQSRSGALPYFDNRMPSYLQLSNFTPTVMAPSVQAHHENEAHPVLPSEQTAQNLGSTVLQQSGRVGAGASSGSTESDQQASREFENRVLIEQKAKGSTYKQIQDTLKRHGHNVVESTLRGRYRSLTKDRNARVRKPHWHHHDKLLLEEGVRRELDRIRSSHPSWTQQQLLGKVSWKSVAEFIVENGGSYSFGNSTCKKQWGFVVRDRMANTANGTY